jgi:hypothetical protein
VQRGNLSDIAPGEENAMLIDEEDVEFGTSHDLLHMHNVHTFVVVDPTLEAKAKVTKYLLRQAKKRGHQAKEGQAEAHVAPSRHFTTETFGLGDDRIFLYKSPQAALHLQ